MMAFVAVPNLRTNRSTASQGFPLLYASLDGVASNRVAFMDKEGGNRAGP